MSKAISISSIFASILILSHFCCGADAKNPVNSAQPVISDWRGAQWIAMEPDKTDEYILSGISYDSRVSKIFGNRKIGFYKLPQFRKEFNVRKNSKIRNATAYVCGLGQFDFFLNGGKVGDHFLDPGWTKYDKEALYVTFNVTSLLHKGSNAIGVMLGNGFFNMPRARYFKLLQTYGAPRLVMMLVVEYEDGTVDNVVTGGDWKACASPITFSSTYGGEDYDANLYQDGWTDPGFDDSSWMKPVIIGPVTPGTRPTDFSAGVWNPQLLPQEADPVKVIEVFPSVRHFRNAKGWLYDLGQNFAGVIRVKVRTSVSSAVRFEMSELMTSDSLIYINKSYSPYYYTYTPKAGTVSVWQPRFSYWGFRYVEVSGAVPEGEPNPEGLPVIEKLEGLFTSNSARNVGSFQCSDDLFNKIDKLIIRAERSNMVSILTDCPHREKLGWLEQDHLMQYSLSYDFDLHRLYSKIIRDVNTAQRPEGIVPCIAPEYVRFSGGFADTPEWGSTFIISPWYIYVWYGDDSLIRNYYPAMRRYLDYLTSRAEDGIVAYGLGDWFDLGPKAPGGAQLTANGVSATAMYYYDICIMEKMARLLGLEDDVAGLGKLAANVKDAFNRKFWDPVTRKYERDSQTANAMALFMGLVTDENRQTVLDNLISDIRSRGNAITAGDIGHRYVIQALHSAGRDDVIYDIESRKDVPGYGWMLEKGATALTESWQALKESSNNHFMLGHIQEWFHGGIGGISPDESGTPETAGWKHFIIAPKPCGDLSSCKVTYISSFGQVVSDWRISGGKSSCDAKGRPSPRRFKLHVVVPKGSSATLIMPGRNERREIAAGSYDFSTLLESE